jgi:hypothetical protein
MVTVFNQGVSSVVKTLAVEIAPHRVNAIHYHGLSVRRDP